MEISWGKIGAILGCIAFIVIIVLIQKLGGKKKPPAEPGEGKGPNAA